MPGDRRSTKNQVQNIFDEKEILAVTEKRASDGRKGKIASQRKRISFRAGHESYIKGICKPS